MKKAINLWQLTGFAVTSLAGTILHFLYEWFEKAVWIAPFSGVNESTWEHMKLLFWPSFIFAIIQGTYFKGRTDFWCIKLRGILLGLFLIPIVFYTFNGAIVKSPNWINVAIFFISAAASSIYEAILFNSNSIICKNKNSAIVAICIIALLFVLFTFSPPKIGLFKDPLTSTYGI